MSSVEFNPRGINDLLLAVYCPMLFLADICYKPDFCTQLESERLGIAGSITQT
ncbi:hypothetical protein CLOSTMETH_03650 [[Clostridium] methylpentosum DSM 5476]|uniref:Uncharacterized protein n=1 Tax=[Clostridium] methylpentosum DSM 5476 TaxID=537013 RepID=C0EIF5_9FIRM|nr:hypothetical protein CLOSTMETH_03650 [[Clostridium] methylpentosum DSM 5476]